MYGQVSGNLPKFDSYVGRKKKAPLSHRAKGDDSLTPTTTQPNEFLQMSVSNGLITVCY